jgi:hypothetical protein
MSSMQALALHSAKLAQAQIAEEQKAEQQRIAKAKNTEQLLKMPIPENTDAETIMSIGDGGIDVKRVLKPRREHIIPEGFEVTGLYESGAPKLEKKQPGIDSLSPELQVQARALSRRLYGVRGAEKGLSSIVALMEKGKGADQIEDEVRLSGQSPEFNGAIRGAAQGLTFKLPEQTAQRTMDYIDDELSKGNIEGVQYMLKKVARDTAGAEESNKIIGKERTVELLDEIEGDIKTLQDSGINTNIFSGTAEDVSRNIGLVREPELRKLATKIQAAVLNYRKAMTGVAFSAKESEDYVKMFPSIAKTGDLNVSIVKGLRDSFRGDVNHFYSQQMGPHNYNQIFSMNTGGTPKLDVKIDSVSTPSGKSFKGLWY